jgi:hypothetical protein
MVVQLKGKGAGGMIINLLIAAAGIKLLMIVSNSFVKGADPSGSFYGLISAFLGIGDLIFYGLLALAALIVPYYIYKRRNNKVKETPRPLPA